MKFSIIVCSHRPARRASIQAHFQRVFARENYEIIVIPDAKSLCEGYNRGFAQASGEVIIFSHDDIELIAASTPDIIRRHLQIFDVIGVGGTDKLIDGNWITAGDPHVFCLTTGPEVEVGKFRVVAYGAGPTVVPNIKALDGCFIACKREVAEALGFDEQTFDGFHLYDVDFTYRAFRAGYRLGVCRDLPLIHFSAGSYDEMYQKYKLAFENKFAGMLDSGQHSPWKYVSVVCRHEHLVEAASPIRVHRLLGALAAQMK